MPFYRAGKATGTTQATRGATQATRGATQAAKGPAKGGGALTSRAKSAAGKQSSQPPARSKRKLGTAGDEAEDDGDDTEEEQDDTCGYNRQLQQRPQCNRRVASGHSFCHEHECFFLDCHNQIVHDGVEHCRELNHGCGMNCGAARHPADEHCISCRVRHLS